MLLILEFKLIELFPKLDVGMESGLYKVCLFTLVVAIADYARLLLLSELVDDPLATSIEAFCIFAEKG